MTPRRLALVRVVTRGVAAGVVVLLALRLWQLWRRNPVDFGNVDAALFVAAAVASLAAVAAYGLVWPYLLRRLGVRAPFSWVTLFFVSQLGKYLPGSVWQYAGRVGLARSRGVEVRVTLASIAAEIALSASAAGLAALLLLPVGAAVGLIAAVLLVSVAAVLVVRRLRLLERLAARLPADAVASLRSAPTALLLYLGVWAVYGVAFWLTGRALFAVPVSDLAYDVGAFALAWLAGFAAVFVPGGIGVREAVLVALLHGQLGEARAIVLAATSRIVLVAVDLATGVISLSLPTFRGRRVAEVGL